MPGSSFSASAMPSGSNATTFAPADSSAGTISSDGASRISSVLALKVRPSTQTVRPATEPPQKSMTLRAMRFLRLSFTAMTCSTMVCGASTSRAV